MNLSNRALLLIIGLFIIIKADCQDYRTEISEYRSKKYNSFLTDERSPLKLTSDLEKLDFFEPNELYKIECSFALSKGMKPFDLPTYSGATRLYIEYGIASCKIDNIAIDLHIYKNLTLNNPIYKNHLFLPIKDLTSSETTYGGGRYIDLTINDIQDNTIIIDLNKLYNPWCAYSDGFNCPIPPKENHLGIPILAGEKNYTGSIKH